MLSRLLGRCLGSAFAVLVVGAVFGLSWTTASFCVFGLWLLAGGLRIVTRLAGFALLAGAVDVLLGR